MGKMNENILLMENRAYMYRLLGRIYKQEVDQELFSQLSTLHFNSECDEGELSEGYHQFEAFFKKTYLDALTDLAVDYAKVFLGAGIAEGTVAYPYESVYTSPEHLVMQKARDQVLDLYREFGLDKEENLDIFEDHLGLELEFMAFLCKEGKEALHCEDYEKVEALLQTQSLFLEKHLLNWISPFCDDILKCSESEFYKAVAKMTRGYLTLEQEILQYLNTSVMISAHKAQAHQESSIQNASNCCN